MVCADLELNFCRQRNGFFMAVYHLLAQLAFPFPIEGEGNVLRWKETSVPGFSRELHLRSIWGSAHKSQSEDDFWVEEQCQSLVTHGVS